MNDAWRTPPHGDKFRQITEHYQNGPCHLLTFLPFYTWKSIVISSSQICMLVTRCRSSNRQDNISSKIVNQPADDTELSFSDFMKMIKGSDLKIRRELSCFNMDCTEQHQPYKYPHHFNQWDTSGSTSTSHSSEELFQSYCANSSSTNTHSTNMKTETGMNMHDMHTDAHMMPDTTTMMTMSFVFRTPRGKTTVATIPTSAPYEMFLRALLERAAETDQLQEEQEQKKHMHAHSASAAHGGAHTHVPHYHAAAVPIANAGANLYVHQLPQLSRLSLESKNESRSLSRKTKSPSPCTTCIHDSPDCDSGMSVRVGEGPQVQVQPRQLYMDMHNIMQHSQLSMGRLVRRRTDVDRYINIDEYECCLHSHHPHCDCHIQNHDLDEIEDSSADERTHVHTHAHKTSQTHSHFYSNYVYTHKYNSSVEECIRKNKNFARVRGASVSSVVEASASHHNSQSRPQVQPQAGTGAGADSHKFLHVCSTGSGSGKDMEIDLDRDRESTVNFSKLAYVVLNGKILGRKEYTNLATSTAATQQQQQQRQSNHLNTATQASPTVHHISLRIRLRGGIDRQNRVGSKFGGGGVSSGQQSERERKERLRQLALETVDLAKDPYLMRNHLGTYECKLCLTLHTNEGNYLAHTQGKKHQAGLAKRAAMEAKLKGKDVGPVLPASSTTSSTTPIRRVKIGRPGYEITKSRHYQTNQRCLSFQLHFPEIESGVQPRHRFMSAFEQRVESPPDRRFQYLLIAAEPYETVAFKIPNEKIERSEGMFVTNWDRDEKKFTLTLYFVDVDGGN